MTKSSWQRIPDDGSCDCESSLRKFSPSSRRDEVWRIRRTYTYCKTTFSDRCLVKLSGGVELPNTIVNIGVSRIGADFMEPPEPEGLEPPLPNILALGCIQPRVPSTIRMQNSDDCLFRSFFCVIECVSLCHKHKQEAQLLL